MRVSVKCAAKKARSLSSGWPAKIKPVASWHYSWHAHQRNCHDDDVMENTSEHSLSTWANALPAGDNQKMDASTLCEMNQHRLSNKS